MDILAQNPTTYVHHLKTYFFDLLPISSIYHTVPVSVPVNIDKWAHILLRNDSVKGPLTQHYKGALLYPG